MIRGNMEEELKVLKEQIAGALAFGNNVQFSEINYWIDQYSSDDLDIALEIVFQHITSKQNASVIEKFKELLGKSDNISLYVNRILRDCEPNKDIILALRDVLLEKGSSHILTAVKTFSYAFNVFDAFIDKQDVLFYSGNNEIKNGACILINYDDVVSSFAHGNLSKNSSHECRINISNNRNLINDDKILPPLIVLHEVELVRTKKTALEELFGI